jgi:hypothetical protein
MIKMIYKMAMNDKIYTELNDLSLSKNVNLIRTFKLYQKNLYGNFYCMPLTKQYKNYY